MTTMMRSVGTTWLAFVWTVVWSAPGWTAAEGASYPVDFKGEPIGRVLSSVSTELGRSLVLDKSVDEVVLETRIWMSAEHMTGEQVLRWTARLAGLSGVSGDGVFVVSLPERLPRVWRATGYAAATQPAGRDASSDWDGKLKRRADIRWIDATLGYAARDVATRFGVDVVFSPAVRADQGMIYLEGQALTLEAVAAAIAEQLKAKVVPLDGALWVYRPRDGGEAPGWRDAGGPDRTAGYAGFGRRGESRSVTIDRTVADWDAFARRFTGMTSLLLRLGWSAEGEPPYVVFEAQGSASELMAGLELLGVCKGSVERGEAGHEAVWVIASPVDGR